MKRRHDNNANEEKPLAAIEVRVPDIGDFKDVPVIELLVKPGDVVKKDDSLVTLESDKATMEVPAPQPGTVKELRVKLGDKVSEGSTILTLEAAASAAAAGVEKPAAAPAKGGVPLPAAPAKTGAQSPAPKVPAPEAVKAAAPAPPAPSAPAAAAPSAASAPAPAVERTGSIPPHASPGVRRFARELGVDRGAV